jgi:hypothetical protein
MGKGDSVRFEVDRNREDMGGEMEAAEAAMAVALDRERDKGDVELVEVDNEAIDVDSEELARSVSAILASFGFDIRLRNLSAPSCRVGPGVDPRRIVGGEWIGVEGVDGEALSWCGFGCCC